MTNERERLRILKHRHVTLRAARAAHAELLDASRKAWTGRVREALKDVTTSLTGGGALLQTLATLDLDAAFDASIDVAHALVDLLESEPSLDEAERACLERLAKDPRIVAPQPDDPLEHPNLLGQDVKDAELGILRAELQLSDETLAALSDAAPSVLALDESVIAALVDQRKLNGATAAQLGAQITFARALGDDIQRAVEIGGAFATKGVRTLRDFARLPHAGWREIAEDQHLTLSEEELDSLGRVARSSFPGTAMLARAVDLVGRDPALASRVFPSLGLDDAKAATADARLRDIAEASRAHPDIAHRPPTQDSVRAAIPNADDATRDAVRETLMTHARVLRLAEDPNDAVSLLAAGLHSPVRIAKQILATSRSRARELSASGHSRCRAPSGPSTTARSTTCSSTSPTPRGSTRRGAPSWRTLTRAPRAASSVRFGASPWRG